MNALIFQLTSGTPARAHKNASAALPCSGSDDAYFRGGLLFSKKYGIRFQSIRLRFGIDRSNVSDSVIFRDSVLVSVETQYHGFDHFQ